MDSYLSIVIGALALISLLFVVLNETQRNTLYQYTQVVSLVAIILGIASLRLQMQRDDSVESRVMRVEFLGQAYEPMERLQRLFIDEYPYLNRLYQEMNGQRVAPAPGLDLAKDEQLSQHAAAIIFNDMQRVFELVEAERGIRVNDTAPIRQFASLMQLWRCWMASPMLQCYWRQRRGVMSPDFVRFVETRILNKPLQV